MAWAGSGGPRAATLGCRDGSALARAEPRGAGLSLVSGEKPWTGKVMLAAMTSRPPPGHLDPHVLQRAMEDAHADDPAALGVGLRALNEAIERCRAAAPSRDLPRVFAAAAEAVWWICSLDEHLNGGRTRMDTEYAQERDADSGASCIAGLRWARDRHTHQVFLSARLDYSWYLDPRPGARIYVPAGGSFVWRLAELIYPQGQVEQDRRRRDAPLRRVYVEHVQGRATSEPLEGAERWLTSRIG